MALFTRKALLFLVLFFAANTAKGLTASFTADYMAGCSPLVVHFTNTSIGATSYSWNLGNGTTSALTDVSGSYITPGTYTVTLTAYDGSSSVVQTMTITVYPSPTVSFFASDTSVCPGSPVTFTSTTVGGVAGALTYSWNFGDGSTSTAASPTHAYSGAGYYNVTLIVTNAQGCTSSLTVGAYVHVFTPSIPNFTVTDATFCHAPGTATFTPVPTGTGPFTYYWTLGDGATSTSTNPTETYTAPGSYNVTLHMTDGNGCTDSIVHAGYIYVGSSSASFTYASHACMFTPVTFTNTSSAHTSSSWTFGDGGASIADNGIHTYNTPGTYTVRLIISEGSCADTVTNTIIIYPATPTTFTTGPAHPCPAPVTITFTASPPGSGTTWSFGDGGTGSGTPTTHTYGGDGIDTVKMIQTDANGCKDTVIQYDTISSLILVILDTPATGCAPLPVDFLADVLSEPDGTYPYAITSYSWTLGVPGATASTASTAYTYTATGVYTVTATATTANGCTVHDTSYVVVGSPPTVTFTATPLHMCYHHNIATFTATLSSGSGPADSYQWDFGDGSGEVDSSLTGTDITMHSFTHPGVFHVTLIAYYNGCPSVPFIFADSFIIDSPMAVITDGYNCTPYTKVTFADGSLGDNAPVWMFGDGTTSTLSSPVHVFPAESIYTVTLTTYNIASGCRDTTTTVINLIPPVPHIHADDTAICQTGIVHFSPVVTGGAASAYYWYVNGALLDNDTDANFTDTFKIRGLYTIMLVIKDEHLCQDTFTRTNYIIVAKPIDTFSVTPLIGCAPLHSILTDLSTDVTGAVVTNYSWSFGDGTTTTTGSSPISHTYTAAGTFNIQEIVTDNIGCKDTVYVPNAISAWKPHAVFYAGSTYPCQGISVHFTNTSTGTTGAFWMFGDGDTTSVSSPDHTYYGVGAYTVKLVVFDVHGCSDTAVYTGYINVTKPHAAFYMDDSSSICPPLSVHFFNTSTGATSYGWSFGDGSTSVLVAPGNLYPTSGSDTVRLIATNSYGCHDTAYGHVTIYGYAGGFTYAPLTGCMPLTVTFHANISNVPSIIWDYADGTTSLASGADSSVHTYTVPGAYVPKLILSDNTGCQNSNMGLDTIKVDAVLPGFTTAPHPVCVNTNINFTDTSFSYFSTITSWNWVLPSGMTSSISSPPYFFATVGSYPVTLTVSDGWGCTGTTIESIVVNPPPTITASPDTTVCVGDAATLQGFGGASYAWTPAATVSCTPCQTTEATPTVVTTYTVIGTDSNGCVNTDTVMVSLRTTTISAVWKDTEVCRNVIVQLYDTGATKFTWLPAAGLNSNTIYNPEATPAATTTYTVIAQLGSCIPDTNYVTLTIDQLPTVDAGPDQELLAGTQAQLQATGTLIDHYLWTPGSTLNCDTCSDPLAGMITTTTYTVVVTSSHGCKASDSVTILLHCDESQLFVPNSFTPNGDGQNDVFYPRGGGISIVKSFRIYNRWGELLFERSNISMNDVTNAWDGSYKGGAPRPDVYVYLIEAVCGTGQALNVKGDVTIIR